MLYRIFLILGILMVVVCESQAKMQYFYNPDTNHMIIDNTNRPKAEVLKTVNKEGEADDYQQLILTEQEEKDILAETLSVTIENGQLTKKILSPPQNMPAINQEELKKLIEATFGKPAKNINEQDIADYLIANPVDKNLVKLIMKWLLYESRSQGNL